MVVIAGHDDDLSAREHTPELFEERSRNGQRVPPRPVAQLQHVAEKDQPLDVIQSIEQGRARPSPAQHIGAGSSTEVQV